MKNSSITQLSIPGLNIEDTNRYPHISVCDIPSDLPIVVSYGGGKNSTALLEGMWLKNIVPDAIIFADTGNEHPWTYDFIQWYNSVLVERGFPSITVVRYKMKKTKPRKKVAYSLPKWSLSKDGFSSRLIYSLLSFHYFRQYYKYQSLGEECVVLQGLPSPSYSNRHSCSDKWKIKPIEQFIKENYTQEIQLWVGIHAGETSRLFTKSGNKKDYYIPGFGYKAYPLVDWGIYQKHCESLLNSSLAKQPQKSSCWFCPYSKPAEVRHLKSTHPDLYQVGVNLELSAKTTTATLGKNFSWSEIQSTEVESVYRLSSRDIAPSSCGCVDL